MQVMLINRRQVSCFKNYKRYLNLKLNKEWKSHNLLSACYNFMLKTLKMHKIYSGADFLTNKNINLIFWITKQLDCIYLVMILTVKNLGSKVFNQTNKIS